MAARRWRRVQPVRHSGFLRYALQDSTRRPPSKRRNTLDWTRAANGGGNTNRKTMRSHTRSGKACLERRNTYAGRELCATGRNGAENERHRMGAEDGGSQRSVVGAIHTGWNRRRRRRSERERKGVEMPGPTARHRPGWESGNSTTATSIPELAATR